MAEEHDPTLPVAVIDFQMENHECDENNKSHIDRKVGPHSYIGKGSPPDRPCGCIDLTHMDYEKYLQTIKKKYKTTYDAKKADQQGYICKPFLRRVFIPDVVEINYSMQTRGGEPMREPYTLTVAELGGPPKKYEEFKYPDCPMHYSIFWGVFASIPGYKQGDVTTNEKLLAYANMRRMGNLIMYSQMIGHSDYLKYGIMYRLHFAILEWLCKKETPFVQGLNHMMHGYYTDGGEGRILWRKKLLFKPAYLITN